ncbi:MAG: alkaline phosphatase [Thermodesulfobacteriota bacterium]
MRYRRMKTWVSALAVLSLILWTGLASAEMPKNVILMISDGMGYNTVKATNYYTGTTPIYENFAVKYGVSTFSAGKPGAPAIGYDPGQAWSNFGYVATPGSMTDSASAATALATGVKIYDNQLNITTTGTPLKTITEIAKDLGKSAGVVTTVQWSHATPAGMFAHNASRNNYAAIANEMLGSTSPLNVIMGAGNPNYDDSGKYQLTPKSANYVGGSATWSALNGGTLNGWTHIQDKAAFEALANNPNPPLDKVVGTFQAYSTAQQSRDAAVKGSDPANPSGVALNTNVPSLATMSQGALNVLNKNTNGFFLMVEGGAVDWANHANQLGRMIEEQMDFNAAVQAVYDWVNANSSWNDTLLIVTADHECGHLWGPTPGTFNDVVDNGVGNLPGAHFNSGDHTNALIPLYAIGAGANLLEGYADQFDPVRGLYVDNTEIFQVMNGTAHVPIPASVLLLGSGLIGLGFLRRKQPCA